jgi:hypothetical protein
LLDGPSGTARDPVPRPSLKDLSGSKKTFPSVDVKNKKTFPPAGFLNVLDAPRRLLYVNPVDEENDLRRRPHDIEIQRCGP